MELGHWIFWLGAGSIISVIVASVLQARARRSLGWRFFACCIIAVALAPTIVPAYSHGVGWAIAPAGLIFLGSLFSFYAFGFFVLGALPILIVASVLFCIWSVGIDVESLDGSKRKEILRCYQCKGTIEAGEEECPACHLTWK